MDVSPSLSFSFRSFVFLSNTPRLHSRGGFWSADRHTQEQTATLHSMLFFFCFLNTQKQHHRFWLASLLGSLLKLLEDANRLVDGLLLLLEGFLLLGECLLLLRQLLLDRLEFLLLLLLGIGDLRLGLSSLLLDERDLVRRATLFGHGVTDGLVELAFDEALELVEVAPTLIVLSVLLTCHVVLDGGVPSHANLLAYVLAGSRAVDVNDHHGVRVLVVLSKLVPVGLHGLAVSSPRREELHEDVLARSEHGGVEVTVRSLERALRRCERAERKHNQRAQKRSHRPSHAEE
mmetsp:Transcript_6208/g.14115  ORF Transcript_6208/g.14115 Transcript_6208/m.14115 type:complete len:290 (+) Transcript_6208:193-1062(+)